jgi:predicted secreted hydrolase
VSQKGHDPSQASHYISFTRLGAKGTLQRGNSAIPVAGLAWMDHEFFSEGRNTNLAGWDWFAIQLDNNEELMLYRLRQKSAEPDPYSSGTYVDAHGNGHFLSSTEFSLTPAAPWQSPHSKARYPLEWRIDVPSLDLHLQQKTALSDQELYSHSAVTPSYWEGAVTYVGQLRGKPVNGVGYLEMTGYDKAVWLRQR